MLLFLDMEIQVNYLTKKICCTIKNWQEERVDNEAGEKRIVSETADAVDITKCINENHALTMEDLNMIRKSGVDIENDNKNSSYNIQQNQMQ